MIQFNYETDFKIENESSICDWISSCVVKEGFELGEINYIFCDDAYLLNLNESFLNHDTLTDIISFDYSLGKLIGGDIFISVERVKENAVVFSQSVENEMNRVIIHGVLHFMGYKDKLEEDKRIMRLQEDACLNKLTN